jgi:hypothetical protein
MFELTFCKFNVAQWRSHVMAVLSSDSTGFLHIKYPHVQVRMAESKKSRKMIIPAHMLSVKGN